MSNVQVDIVSVRIQNVALLSILEQYQRRSETCPVRLVGAILGNVVPFSGESPSSNQISSVNCHQFVADIRYAFPVPHSEVNDQVSINSDYYRSRMELHKKCYGRESALLGWYSIQRADDIQKVTDTATFAKNAEFIKDSFAREVGSAGAPYTLNLAVTIDKNGKITCETFCCESINVKHQQNTVRSGLTQLSHEIIYGVSEVFVLNGLKSVISKEYEALEKKKDGKLVVPLEKLNSETINSQRRAEGMISTLQTCLEEVKEGKRKLDSELLQSINEILSSFGRSEEERAELDSFVKNMSSLSNSVMSLKSQLDRSDDLLLSQPYIATKSD